MIVFFEFPVMLIILLVLGLFGANLVSVLTVLLVISLVISVLWLFVGEGKFLNVIIIVAHVALIWFLDGKEASLWDVARWFFSL